MGIADPGDRCARPEDAPASLVLIGVAVVVQ